MPSTALVAGFSSFGLAGLTAVDFLMDQLDLDQTGHVAADDLPTFTPFEEGTPRHHTRLFSRDDLDLTVLVNELFVPPMAGDSFAEELLSWGDRNGVEEVTVVAGVPVPHGPEEHRAFYVATEDYQETTLAETDIEPMRSGFLDGVTASLLGHGMDSDLRVGIFLTPVHAQAPDVEAALRLIGAVETIYGLEFDTSELEAFAAQFDQYYQNLADRLEQVAESSEPKDWMFM